MSCVISRSSEFYLCFWFVYSITLLRKVLSTDEVIVAVFVNVLFDSLVCYAEFEDDSLSNMAALFGFRGGLLAALNGLEKSQILLVSLKTSHKR